MTQTKKTHSKRTVKPVRRPAKTVKHPAKDAKRPLKIDRRMVGGGSVEVPSAVLRSWKQLAVVSDTVKAKQNAQKFRELWKIFNKGREQISRELLQSQDTAEAYVLGFHLPNAARAALLCRRIAQRVGITAGSKPGVGSGMRLGDWLGKSFTQQRIFDLGCGSGAWSQVWLSEVCLKRNAAYLIDASRALLEMAAKGIAAVKLAAGSSASIYVETIPKAIAAFNFAQYDAPGQSLDVYIMGYVWNELINDRAAQAHVMARLESCVTLKRDALLLLAEPATDEFALGAMALRDELCAAGWVAIYPCPTGARACPMLNAKGGVRDWCFSEGGWRKPDEYMQLEEDAGIGHNKLNSAMFALASPELALRLPKMAPDLRDQTQVVVGKPLLPGGRPGLEKGFSYLLCTPDGLMKTSPKKIEIKFAKPRGSTVSGAPKPAEKSWEKSREKSGEKSATFKRGG